MLKISFSCTDEFDQESTLTKTFANDVLDIESHFELLVGEFKNFILAAGFSQELADSIEIKENTIKDEF